MISGNVSGIKEVILDKLDKCYDIKPVKDDIIDQDFLNLMCQVSSEINREICTAVDRKGRVINISVGDSSTVELPLINISEKKLSGVRIIHTHPNGNPMLSSVDISALIKLKLDLIVAAGVSNGKCEKASVGFIQIENGVLNYELISNISKDELIRLNFKDKVKYIEDEIKKDDIVEEYKERALLIGIDTVESLDELSELAKSCGILVKNKIIQRRNKIDSAFFIGKGKAYELSLLAQECMANVIIFDDELSASQIRNLEEVTGAKVIDRTTLILEIFARRAKTKEAKVQVELAQLRYRLPRLIGMGAVLSRTGGGIGTRGPGEKKLETDRRHIKDRVYELQGELERLRKVRDTQRERRSTMPQISLVGYTNAGKSTLRNKICDIASPKDILSKEKIFAADMLFATLDTTTRVIVLPDGRNAALTDTVGFISKLPYQLVESFKSTLEETRYADLLVHVIDVSSDNIEKQIDSVIDVVSQIGADKNKQIFVLNKIDKVKDNINEIQKSIEKKYDQYKVIAISAKTGENLEGLLSEISKNIASRNKIVTCLIPYDSTEVVAYLHRRSKIISEEYLENGIEVKADVDEEVYNRSKKYIIKEG